MILNCQNNNNLNYAFSNKKSYLTRNFRFRIEGAVIIPVFLARNQ